MTLANIQDGEVGRRMVLSEGEIAMWCVEGVLVREDGSTKL